MMRVIIKILRGLLFYVSLLAAAGVAGGIMQWIADAVFPSWAKLPGTVWFLLYNLFKVAAVLLMLLIIAAACSVADRIERYVRNK